MINPFNLGPKKLVLPNVSSDLLACEAELRKLGVADPHQVISDVIVIFGRTISAHVGLCPSCWFPSLPEGDFDGWMTARCHRCEAGYEITSMGSTDPIRYCTKASPHFSLGKAEEAIRRLRDSYDLARTIHQFLQEWSQEVADFHPESSSGMLLLAEEAFDLMSDLVDFL